MKVREVSLSRREPKKGMAEGWAGAQSRHSSQRDSWGECSLRCKCGYIHLDLAVSQSLGSGKQTLSTLLRDQVWWVGGDQIQLKGP